MFLERNYYSISWSPTRRVGLACLALRSLDREAEGLTHSCEEPRLPDQLGSSQWTWEFYSDRSSKQVVLRSVKRTKQTGMRAPAKSGAGRSKPKGVATGHSRRLWATLCKIRDRKLLPEAQTCLNKLYKLQRKLKILFKSLLTCIII